MIHQAYYWQKAHSQHSIRSVEEAFFEARWAVYCTTNRIWACDRIKNCAISCWLRPPLRGHQEHPKSVSSITEKRFGKQFLHQAHVKPLGSILRNTSFDLSHNHFGLQTSPWSFLLLHLKQTASRCGIRPLVAPIFNDFILILKAKST